MPSTPKRAETGTLRLHLVANRREPGREARRRSPLALWHLLSLDAPTVAALWTVLAGWCAGVRLSWVDPVAMFVAVWMLYAADRLLDARLLAEGLTPVDLEERHHFHHRHRRWFLPCLVAGTLPLAFLLHRLAPSVLHLYALLVALLTGWLLLVHAQPWTFTSSRRLPKEIAVGLFFPAAVFIPTVARAPVLRVALLIPALLFAGVCTLNCLFLYAWEHPNNHTRAHATTRFALRSLVPLGGLLVFLSLAAAILLTQFRELREFASLPHPAALPLSCGASAGALLLLHAARHRIPALRLRALADVALLTPLLPLSLAALRLGR